MKRGFACYGTKRLMIWGRPFAGGWERGFWEIKCSGWVSRIRKVVSGGVVGGWVVWRGVNWKVIFIVLSFRRVLVKLVDG